MLPDDNASTLSGRSLGRLSRRALENYARVVRSVLDPIAVAVLLTDERGQILLYNRRFEELAGLGPADRLKMTDLRAAFAALGATLGAAEQSELLGRPKTTETLELLGERTVVCTVVPLTLDQPHDCRMIAFRDVTLERRELDELEHRALHDQLTGLPNRELLVDRLERALSRQAREGGAVGVAFIDLDGFKEVNDRLGHAAGDRILVEAAGRLQRELRELDSVGRFGGDEFVVVCDGIGDEPALVGICARIQHSLTEPYELDDEPVTLSTSLGAVLAWDHDVAPRKLIERTDALMYTAKRSGSRREIVVDGWPRERDRRAWGARALRETFEAGQLAFAYLPIVDLGDKRMTAVEGLLRCQHPELLNLPPTQLVDLVEQTRAINRLAQWALGEAVRAARVLLEATGAPVRVVVNLSEAQLADGALPEAIAAAAGAEEIGTDAVGFDIPASVLDTTAPWLEQRIASLRELGCPLYADDVVEPEVDAERIATLGFAGLKLDGSMIYRSLADADFAARAHAAVRRARSHGLCVIGEQIDNERRLQIVEDLGCDCAQGYGFYGFPRAVGELAMLVD